MAAVIPVAVTSCATCTTQASLLEAAHTYVSTWVGKEPPGYAGVVGFAPAPACTGVSHVGATIVLVSSATLPIGGLFYACQRSAHGITSNGAVAINANTDAQTISADAAALFRSAKTKAITLPPGTPITDTQEIISAWLSSAAGIPLEGSTSLGFWHALANFPQLIKGTFLNVATGEIFTLWNGDVITVTDSSGNTAQFQWTPLSTIQWTLVPGSIRIHGNPVGATPPVGALPGAALTVTYPNGPTVIVTPYNDTLPSGTITVGDPIDIPNSPPIVVCLGLGPCP
jgi:hypothetical protein